MKDADFISLGKLAAYRHFSKCYFDGDEEVMARAVIILIGGSVMQFGLTASGTPAQAKNSIQLQADSIRKDVKDSNSMDFVNGVEDAIASYLDEQKEGASVMVSCTLNITVSSARG